ncbi:MAG: inositol monophosphatase, monophosphatase [Candidatus Saccharibacteria bacterium]|nr:inositol monophosphatase, monophosphatase [Candidatus Saccharibacteria bacterium]
MGEPTIERRSEVGLGPEYVKQSLDILETYFRDKRDSLMLSYGDSNNVQIKPDGSLLTPRDSEVEEELKQLLKLLNPDIGFAGEETPKEGSIETYWVIDPIDSTRSFIEGRPFCTNMAALIHKGKVMSAVVFEFAAEPAHMFTATADGAMMDGQPLIVDPQAVDQSVWIDSKDVTRRNTLYEAAVKNGLIRSELPPPNGYRLTQLAQGNLGVQVYTNADAGQYDLVPGLFIAQQAGVTVRNIGKDSWDPNNREVIAYTSQEAAQAVEPSLLTN